MERVVKASFTVTTPLFCHGANQREEAEIRPPSFKGVLRFWWRALAWNRLKGDLRSIKKEEDELFGSPDTGQSKVSLFIDVEGKPKVIQEGDVLSRTSSTTGPLGDGALYLGYGVMSAFGRRPKNGKPKIKKGELKFACIHAPIDFTVRLNCRDTTERELATLLNALKALGTFGGMGAKSRKGYGSLVLDSLRLDSKTIWSSPAAVDGLRNLISELASSGQEKSPYPEYTAFSGHTRVILCQSSKRIPVELLDLIGREMVRYRAWGYKGKILGGNVKSERKFRDDHDLMKKHSNQRDKHPHRICFGLPHDYGKSAYKEVRPYWNQIERRASPLFIHLHQLGGEPTAVVSLLTARFLPEGHSDISVGEKKIPQKPEDELYRPAHSFLDRLLDEKQRKERFVHVEEVHL